MKKSNIFLLLIVLSTCLVNTLQAQTPPRMRLIVVDVSNSMDGGYIEEVRKDLLTHLQKDPPSKRSPLGLILFAEEASPVEWFRNTKPAMDFVHAIRAEPSGTSIASGLVEAIKQIKKYGNKVHVSLVLYTDDEDATPAETKAVGEQLSRLFASQQQKNLEQEVVIRSWSDLGAGAVIESILAKNPSVTVKHTTEPVFLKAKLAQPPKSQNYHATFSAEATGRVHWDQKNPQVAIYEVEWTVQTIGDPSATGTPYKFSLVLDSLRHGKLHSGNREFLCVAPGTTKGRMEIRVPIAPGDWRTGKVSTRPLLTTSLLKQPPGANIRLSGTKANLSQLPPPPAKETQVSMEVRSVTPGTWFEVPNIAFYDITVELAVNGPLPEGSKVQVESPPGVTRFELRPETIREGSQTVSILMAAAVKPTPEQTTYQLKITPPPNTPLIHFLDPKPLEVQLAAPAPVQITSFGSSGNNFRANRFDAGSETTVQAQFQLKGPVSGRFARQLQLNVRGDHVHSSLGAVSPNQTFLLPVSVPTQGEPSYFFDSVVTQSIEVTAGNAGENVSAGQFQVHVLTFATFKKHLLIGLTLLALVGGPFFVLRLVRSLRFSSDEDSKLVDGELQPTL